jgi:hypothetical protein
MVGLAIERAKSCEPMPGLIATTTAQSIGSTIDDILLIVECMSEQELQNQIVIYLPYRD